MNRVYLWVIASIVTFALIATLVVGFVVSLGIGFVGAINACGISLIAGGGDSSKTASTPTATPSMSSAKILTSESTPASSQPVTPVELGAAAKAYFNLFSASEQAEMKKNAALIVSEGVKRPEKLTRHDIEAATGIAIQESHITNLLVATDHDSLGIYQQRPSQETWGTAAQIVDPVHAINKFYDHLVKIPADQRAQMALIDIGIKVQIPDPDAYKRSWQWNDVAKDIVATYMSGGSDDPSGVICSESAGVSTGDWQLPLTKDSYCTSDPYGMRWHPILGVWRLHAGLDMACNNGDPIYAVHDGTIKMAGVNGSFGNYVEIEHRGNISTGYAHMARISDSVSKGSMVKTGQVIGYVGTSGGSTGPHLHFLVKEKGGYIDPVTYMDKHGVKLK